MKFKGILIGCLLSGLCACERTPDVEVAPAAREVEFEIRQSLLSRAGKEEFSVGDSIGIFAVARSEAGSTALPGISGNQAHNVKWVKTEEGWLPDSPFDKVIWTSDGKPLDFYAYYPYRRDVADPTAIELSVGADQNGEGGLEVSDALRAVNTGGLTDGKVELVFNHLFSLLEVGVSSDVVPITSLMRVTVNGVATKVAMNLGTGESTALSEGTVVLLPVDSGHTLFQGILPAQSVPEGTKFLQCEQDGVVYIYQSDGVNLLPGQQRRFELKLR